MGRHRRSAAGRAAAGTSLYADGRADTEADTAVNPSGGRSHRRRKRAAAPVRTGLLGVSAAVAVGAVAVATGILPGGDNYRIGGGGSDKVEAAESPSELEPQGGGSVSADDRETGDTGRGTERSASPSASPSTSSAKPSATPSGKPSAEKTGSGTTATGSPSRTAGAGAEQPSAGSGEQSIESAAEAEVLTLVNKERAEAGCGPVRADSALAALAEDFSEDMAERGFFSHTDPDGDTPWDRAEAAGISDLGGENIARGQANAQAVMDAWMNSPGHRANILNCEYKTMGVGIVVGSGGPWWTQDFGF